MNFQKHFALSRQKNLQMQHRWVNEVQNFCMTHVCSSHSCCKEICHPSYYRWVKFWKRHLVYLHSFMNERLVPWNSVNLKPFLQQTPKEKLLIYNFVKNIIQYEYGTKLLKNSQTESNERYKCFFVLRYCMWRGKSLWKHRMGRGLWAPSPAWSARFIKKSQNFVMVNEIV